VLVFLSRSLFVRGDPYESSDAVYGVKSSLIVDMTKIADEAVAEKFNLSVHDWEMQYDFVMVSEVEAIELKLKNAHEALRKLGSTVELVNGLPVADVD
jgi:hypothetical protein